MAESSIESQGYSKPVNALIRIYLYFLLCLFFFTGGISMFILAPLYKMAFAPAAAYKELNIAHIWGHVYKIIWRSVTQKSYRDMYPQKLTDPPIFYNNLQKVKIKDSWDGEAGNCDKCENSCCEQINCPMYIKGSRRCLSFGSIYFGYLLCGRHPENQAQMDLYNCPKWEVR